jgi:ATP-dependent exoDNAse (exonuclease V) alpha subunit
MVLKNQYYDDHNLLYANGDTGEVTYVGTDVVCVNRDRDGTRLEIGFADVDDAVIIGHDYTFNDDGTERRITLKSKPTGGIKYMPLTQAWAITTHKAQGLTLDAVQVNLPEQFFGHPAMVYTACSRCKEPANLVLVGGERFLGERCRVDRNVTQWIAPHRQTQGVS